MGERFTPNLDYIFGLSIEDQKPEIIDAMERLLKAWGKVHRGELLSLGYAAAHIWARASRDRLRTAVISDDEYMALDAALLVLRQEAPAQTEALSYRYLKGWGWSEVAKAIKRSPRTAARRSEVGLELLYNYLAKEAKSAERFELSAKILGEELVLKYCGRNGIKVHKEQCTKVQNAVHKVMH